METTLIILEFFCEFAFLVIFAILAGMSLAFVFYEFAMSEIKNNDFEFPHENCDEACFYHCTKNGTQEPDCLTENKKTIN